MSWQQNYRCMFAGSSHHTWMETNGNSWCVWAIWSQQFSHFIIFPIDTSQLFVTEHPAGKAGYSVMSLLQCLAQGQGKRKRKKINFLVSKTQNSVLAFLNYGCMFPGSPCCTWTETNGNIPRQTLNSGHCPPFIPKSSNTSLLTC